jgi:sister chromatid cohesion protein PDS5
LKAELLKIIDEKHPLREFMGMLSVRCSYLLINKEHVKEFLSIASEEKSAGNIDLLACMNLLTVITSTIPYRSYRSILKTIYIAYSDPKLIL